MQAAGLSLFFCCTHQPAWAEPGPHRLPWPTETGTFHLPVLQWVSPDGFTQPPRLTRKLALNAEVEIMLSDCFLVIVSLEMCTKAFCPREKCAMLQMGRNTSPVISSNRKTRYYFCRFNLSCFTWRNCILLTPCSCFGEGSTHCLRNYASGKG